MAAGRGRAYRALGGLWRILRRTAARRASRSAGTPGGGGRRGGIPRLRAAPDGRPRCVACALCAVACPSGCIRIEASAPPWIEEEAVPTTSERWPAVFELDLARCLLCGLCEAACPVQAITLDPQAPVPVAAGRQNLRLGRDALLLR